MENKPRQKKCTICGREFIEGFTDKDGYTEWLDAMHHMTQGFIPWIREHEHDLVLIRDR